MKKISNIISMPTISIYESEYIGIVYNLMFNSRTYKCEYVSIFNDEETIPTIIKFNNLFQIGKHCVFIKNKDCLELQNNQDLILNNCINPLNLKTYDISGNFLGITKDIVLKNDSIYQIILNNDNVINSKDIFNIGKNTIIIKNANSIKLSKFKPNKIKLPKIQEDTKISIATPSSLQQLKVTPIEKSSNNKLITDINFLLNRIIEKDILSYNGEIIAKNGTKITKDIVNKASQYGKLIEIARYSRK